MGTEAHSAQHKRAASTVFDLELDEIDGSKLALVDLEGLQELLTSTSPAQLQLLKDAEQAREISAHGDHVVLKDFAEELAARGYFVCLRTGKPDKCCAGVAALKHTFVVAGVTPASVSSKPDSTQLFVIDPCFRDSFLLSNATPGYQRLCEVLPSIYVGTAEQLVPLVEFMCSQMHIVFAETGISCPPWRQQACMISKWLPTFAEDTPVLPMDSSCSNSNTGSELKDANRSGSSLPTGASEESPFAEVVAAPRLTCQIVRTNSNGSASTCSQLVFTPRVKQPYYDDTSSNILLACSPAEAQQGLVGITPGSGGSFGAYVDSSCIVFAGKTPNSWQVGKDGYLGIGTSWKGSGPAIEACCSYRNDTEELDCEGAMAIKSDNSMHSFHDFYRPEVVRTTSTLTAALAAAGPLSRGVSNVSAARCSLDISRLDVGPDDMDLLTACVAKQPQQQGGNISNTRSLTSPRTPVKHQKSGLLSSALSAAIAGKGLGRI